MIHLAENRYGKSRIRIMKVVRHATHHAMKEWNVRVLLRGDFESCFSQGDNSKILPTDTMKKYRLLFSPRVKGRDLGRLRHRAGRIRAGQQRASKRGWC